MSSENLFKTYQIDLMPIIEKPFGTDRKDVLVDGYPGTSIKASIERVMLADVRAQAVRMLPQHLPPEQRQPQVEQAAQTALEHLVDMVNASFQDPQYRVTSDYLLNPNNYYSYEFGLIVQEYAKAICGKPDDFYFRRGVHTAPRAVLEMTRPFSVRQIYELVPRLVARVLKTDIRVIEVKNNRAIIQWYPTYELSRLDEKYHDLFMETVSEAWKGVLAMIPQINADLPLATVQERRNILIGDEYYEWAFIWEQEARWLNLHLLDGLAISLGLLVYTLLQLPFYEWVNWVVLLPLLGGWYSGRLRRSREISRTRYQHILAQHQNSERQYDQLQAIHHDIQNTNVELIQKVSELTVLHEVGLVVSAIRDLDELFENVLHVIRDELHFDRVLAMLVDEQRNMLVGTYSSGGTPAMAELVRKMAISLDSTDSAAVQAIQTGAPAYLSVEEIAARDTPVLDALGVKEFLIVPLQAKASAVGVLGIDNAISGRPITLDDQGVLMTLGRTVAVAIENVRLYQVLEQKVEERTQQLKQANDALAREKELAEAATQAKSAFLANMSHELRTPLNAIIGYSEMLIEDAEDSGQDMMAIDLHKVQISGKHLLTLINDILDLSKVEAGKMELDLHTFQVSSLLDEVIHTARPLAGQNNNTLTTDYGEHLGSIHTDPTKLRQILLNLLSNAFKFTSDNQVWFTANRQYVNGEDRFTFVIRDNGIGMSEEQIAKLFQAFSQADVSTTREYGGTGLGLAISKHFCEMMGGDITVESALGEGSTFTVNLPSYIPNGNQ